VRFELAAAEAWGIEFRGLEVLSASEQARSAAYWAAALAQVQSGELPTQDAWRVRNHARYATGGQSARGDRTELGNENRWREQMESSLREQGLTIPLGLSARYPYGPAHLEEAQPDVVPIWVVAPPRKLETVLAATQPEWRDAVSSAATSGLDYAIRYAFPAQRISGVLESGAEIPMPGRGESRNGGDPHLTSTLTPLAVGNIGLQGEQEAELAKRLRSAGLLRDHTMIIQSVRWTEGVWLGQVQLPGKAATVEFAFPLLDAHGAARVQRPHVDAGRGSWFENGMELPEYVASLGRHSAAVWPVPRPPGAAQEAARRNWVAGEEAARRQMEREYLCVTASSLQASGGVWVIERLPSSGPLAPDYRVSSDPTRLYDARGDLAGLVIQADLEPQQLMQLLRAWRGVAEPEDQHAVPAEVQAAFDALLD